MQAFPYAAGPMSAGGAPVPGVAYVGAPPNPGGVTPNLTQAPMNPMWNMPTGYTPTYQGAPNAGFPGPAFGGPQITAMPGLPGLGTAQNAPVGGPGGIPGVNLAPVAPVLPPVTTGGPHALPNLPPAPLPAGFPNPFALQQLSPAPSPTATPPLSGGAYATGPQGFMPGLGYFDSLAQWQQSAQMQSMTPQATLSPTVATHMPTPQPTAPGTVNPFWLQLSWQLIQTPAVRELLGDQFLASLTPEQGQALLATGASLLAGPDLQSAFRSLQERTLDQTRFTEHFAALLKSGLLQSGQLSQG